MFEHYFDSFKEFGVLSKAFNNERSSEILLSLNIVPIPKYCAKGFKGVDDSIFGGGAGMVMRPDALKEALINGVVNAGNYGENWKEKLHIIYPAPRGTKWVQNEVEDFAQKYFSSKESKDLVFICGRYEGVDERFLENYVNEFISLGDFILTGGELAVMTILDSSLRYAPGILGNKASLNEESFASGMIEYPLYTRPVEFEGKEVPKVYQTGHHKNIKLFNVDQSKKMTLQYRPDLLKKMSNEEK